METDLARNQDIPTRAAWRDWNNRYTGSGVSGSRSTRRPRTASEHTRGQQFCAGGSAGSRVGIETIISIYREGGILKRLRATPLRPQTILTAHVVVKLILTAATLALLVLAGKRYYPVGVHAPLFSFTIAQLISTWSILSIGFLIASIVPTARFAQPIGAFILYPMIGVSGLFVPVASLPPVLRTVAKVVPLTYAVSLLEGIWKAEGWSAHVGDVAALVLVFVICTALSAKVFRWE